METTGEAPKIVNQYTKLFETYPESEGSFSTTPVAVWSPYKSAKEKLEYERRLPGEIQPFMREYFQKHKNEIVRRRESEDTASFLTHVKEAWGKHLEVNALIDCFLNYELKSPFGDWSLREWEVAEKLLEAGMDSDHQKTMYSGGIKAKLDAEADYLEKKYAHNNPNFKIELLTPSFVTFYEGRDFDHKRYALSILEGNPDEELRADLLSRYHGGDEEIFNERLSRLKFSNDSSVLRTQLEAETAQYKERAVKKGYLLLEKKELKDFEALLEFDNTTEYEYTYSLKGLPDLFLREEVLKRLKSEGFIDKDVSVFSLTFSDFSVAIAKAKEVLLNKSHIRLRPYRQTMDTCGVACIMSILNRTGMPLNEDVERNLWEQVGKPYNFPGGLGLALVKRGFPVTFRQDAPYLLDKNNPEFASSNPDLLTAAKNYVDLHEKAVEAGMRFEVKDWDFNSVRQEIERGNPCIIYIGVTDTISHCILIRGIKDNKLEVIDPLGSIKWLSNEQLDAAIKTPMGKRMIIVEKLPHNFFDFIDEGLRSAGYTSEQDGSSN